MGRAHEVRAASMAKTAAVKSKLYSVYAKEIYQAAKGNPDPVNNLELKRIIEKAKRDQVPADVINRNIDKVKKGVAEDYTTLEYEVFGPGGSTLIVKCLTDNINRALSNVKTVLNKTKGKLAGMGSVSHMYEHLCVIGVANKNEEEIMETLFENEIEINDIEVENNLVIIYAQPQDLFKIKKALENKYSDLLIELEEIGKYSKDSVDLSEEDKTDFKKIYDMLDELDDVSNIYHNVNL